MKRKYWYLNGYRVTFRELLASITVIAVMIIIGFVIADKITASQTEKNAEYYNAIHIKDEEMFRYCMNTSVGNAFVYGDLEAVDTVTYEEIGGEWLYIEKVEEHYNMHTRTVTKTVNGKQKTSTEIYWSWDYAGSEDLHSKEIRFLGVEMDYSKIERPATDYIDTISKSGVVRFKYYGCSPKSTGTIYADLRDGTISDQARYWEGMDIEQAVEAATAEYGIWLFWMIWMVLTGAVVYGFVTMDNRWLEDRK